jgi:hypothetical protein
MTKRPPRTDPDGAAFAGSQLYVNVRTADLDAHIRIEQALAWTQGRLGIDLDVKSWTGSLYQNANRLATLLWLRHRGVDAWLVHLLFTGDQRSPTTNEMWEEALAGAEARLGFEGADVPWAARVMLPAGTYAELTAATTT